MKKAHGVSVVFSDKFWCDITENSDVFTFEHERSVTDSEDSTAFPLGWRDTVIAHLGTLARVES